MFSVAALAGLTVFLSQKPTTEESEQLRLKRNLEQRVKISEALKAPLSRQEFPESLTVNVLGRTGEYLADYTLDPILQKESETLLRRYRPDYGAVFMMDASTGEVLAFASFEKAAGGPVNLISRATYPSASVFKLVTATAAIDSAGVTPGHTIRFNGGNYTLYRKNVLSDKINRWTRTITLREAFAKSYNTAFGRLSLEELSPEQLSEYATRFMYNQTIAADFPVETGVTLIPQEKGYELTEIASGFNRVSRISPVQGAMMAAAVVNEGRMVMPFLVRSLRQPSGEEVYRADQINTGTIMTPDSAEQVRELMVATVEQGTSRRSFRSLHRNRKFEEIEMGGKTGALTGDNPRGRVDWFVGYATDGQRRVALAALTVNKEFWTVRSSFLGKSLFKKAFEPTIRTRGISSAKPNVRSQEASHQ